VNRRTNFRTHFRRLHRSIPSVLRQIAGALGLLLLLTGAGGTAPTTAADRAGGVHELMRQPLSDRPGTDIVVITVDYPPGGATPPHEHPGETYAYVLEGAVTSQLDKQPVRTYTTGQMWSESPHLRHMISKNASTTSPARLLVFFVVPHGTNLTKFLAPK
jgi:quercetin dioxygenase-like cupin family protein